MVATYFRAKLLQNKPLRRRNSAPQEFKTGAQRRLEARSIQDSTGPSEALTAWEGIMGIGAQAEGGITLLSASLSNTAKKSRGSNWRALAKHCREQHLRPLPASASTIIKRLWSAFTRGAVRASELQPRLSSINKRHEELGRAGPAKGPLVAASRKGFSRLKQKQELAPPIASAPSPATFASKALDIGLSSNSATARRKCGLLTFAFLSLARPRTTGQTQLGDIIMGKSSNMQAQLRFFKHDTGRHRLTFRAPRPSNARASRLITAMQKDLRKAGRDENWPLLRSPHEKPEPLTSADVSAVMRKFLTRLQEAPPLGCKHAAKATRSGAASAAHSVGVGIEAMRWMWGSKSTDELRQHYLDPRVTRPQAAEEFFGHLRQKSSETPSPQLGQ